MAGNDVEWTSAQMIENANSWSLAGDVAILNRLKKFSQYLLSETESVSANVDNLLNNLENVSLKLDLTKNEFQSLRNTQFIENRVYEDDETLENEENKKDEKELTEEEKENAIKDSIVTGLKVMEKYFEKIEVSVSDTEEEDNEKSYILQPKDPYADRPLPYLVGSQEWYKKWHVGLLPSESESESEKEEEAYSSSDSEEPLPKDKNLGSETSSELDFTNRNAGPVANSTFNDSLDPRREIFHSSDESSEQSNSLLVKAPISNETFAEQLAAKLGDVISSTTENLQNVNRNPIKKMSHSAKYGDLFSDEPPPLDDLEDAMLPKAAHEGLFSGGRDLFEDNAEDDLFWDQPNKASQMERNSGGKAPSGDKSNVKVSRGLFDVSDSSGEDDIFTVAEKRKIKNTTRPYLQPVKTTLPFVDDQPPEITSKNDNAPVKKKPVGGVSIFGENSNIFSENSRKPGFDSTITSQTSQDIEPKPTQNVKKSIKKTSLFDESSDEDITMPSNKITNTIMPRSQGSIKKLSLFDDTEDISHSKTDGTLKQTGEKKKVSLFGGEDGFSTSDKEDVKNPQENKRLGLFNDDPYQNVELFRPTTKEIVDKSEILSKSNDENKKSVKKVNLFDDDDDGLLKEEEDIFANVTKNKGLFDDLDKNSEKSKGLFEDTGEGTSNKTFANKEIFSKNVFGNVKTEYSSDDGLRSAKIEDDLENKDEGNQMVGKEKLGKTSTKSLFDNLESSGSSEDLFGGFQKLNTNQKENLGLKKGKDSLFENISELDAKSLEKRKDTNKLLVEEKSGDKDAKEIKDLGNSVEEGNLFKDAVLKEVRTEPGNTRQDNLREKNVALKKKGAILFEDSDDDFFGDSKNNDIEVHSVNEESQTSVVKAKNTERLFGFETKNEAQIFNKAKEEGEYDGIIDEAVVAEKNLEKNKTDPSIKDATGQAGGDLDQSKNNLLGKKRKSVGFLSSDGESSSDNNYGFNKTTKEKDKNDLDEKKIAENSKKDLGENSLFQSTEPGTSNKNTEKYENNANIGESYPTHDETLNSHATKNYAIPPPIDLFDPTPPPIDWDAVSDSGESDTSSLTDGLLNQTNFTQSQTRSSLFDEAPPSLDANESSGIVRDLNVTRVETDDSLFCPSASSSRRLSSDIFGEQQSQDSFFITKNRTETSTRQDASLEQIPENVENISSKIEDLTPSGNILDFEEESSVFEKNRNESEEIKNQQGVSLFGDGTKDSQNEDSLEYKINESVKKRASIFKDKKDLDREKSTEKDEDSKDKTRTSPIKTSPGKLQHNLKINVTALMPGAARPKIPSTVTKSTSSDEIDRSATSDPPVGGTSLATPLISNVATLKTVEVNKTASDVQNFEDLNQTKVLHSATKTRAKIPIKRRPSTRQARQEAVRKSMTDFSLYRNEEDSSLSLETDKMPQGSSTSNTNSFLNDLNNKLEVPGGISKKETTRYNSNLKESEDLPEVKGVSLVFGERHDDQQTSENAASKGIFDSSPKEIEDNKLMSSDIMKKENKSIEVLKSDSVVTKPSEKEKSNSIFDNSDLFSTASKPGQVHSRVSMKPKSESNLFGDSGSAGSDEDLFSSTKKSFKKNVDKSSKVEGIPSKKEPKQSIFSDKSDSEDDGDLFGSIPKVPTAKVGKKMVGEASKKANIFGDSEGSSEEELFGSKTTKSKSGGDDFSENTGSSLVSRKVESKNLKIAGVKKLENKEFTDFDPLSALK